MCTGNFVAEERKSGRKTQLGLWVVRFHFASLQTVFPSSFTRGRPAISLCYKEGSLPVLVQRELGSATDLRGFWVQPGVPCFLKRSPSDSLARLETVRALHSGLGFQKPQWGFFIFNCLSLCFRRALQGWIMTDSRASRTIFPEPQLPDPSKHICPYGRNRLEYLKPELQKIKNRCFPWSGQALCRGAPGSPCPLPVLLWVRVITLDLEF